MSTGSIRRAASLAAALALGAALTASCKDDGGLTIAGVCADTCAQLSACQPEFFAEDFGSMDECKSWCEGMLEDDLVESPGCEDEFLAYGQCEADLSCAEYVDEESEACLDEAQAASACDESSEDGTGDTDGEG